MRERVKRLEKGISTGTFEVVPADESLLDATYTREEWEKDWREHDRAMIDAWSAGNRLYRVPPPVTYPVEPAQL